MEADCAPVENLLQPLRNCNAEDPVKPCSDSWSTGTEVTNMCCTKPASFAITFNATIGN